MNSLGTTPAFRVFIPGYTGSNCYISVSELLTVLWLNPRGKPVSTCRDCEAGCSASAAIRQTNQADWSEHEMSLRFARKAL
jgi:hypothetical protein